MNEETPERNQEMSEIKRYRKKPVVIEAVQWDGTSGGANTVIDWISGNEGCARYRCAPGGCTGTEEGHRVAIETLEGTMSADAGDFIIRGVQGEFYPCKPEIFEKTYEAVGRPTGEPPLETSYAYARREYDRGFLAGQIASR